MCFRSLNSKARTAKRNITVYKLVQVTNFVPTMMLKIAHPELKTKSQRTVIFNSQYMSYEYIIGLEYKEKLFKESLQGKTTGKGFYSWREIERAKMALVGASFPEGFGLAQYVVLKCVIPKGSMYYVSRADSISPGQFCSNRIRPVGYRLITDKEKDWRTEPF